MYYRSLIILFICIVVLSGRGLCQDDKTQSDTSRINSVTREAYIMSRSNPDMTIVNASRALIESAQINYTPGKADAALAIGMAYLAKFNPGDSALYYNRLALSLYDSLNNIRGQARACYGLCYVFSFKGDLKESEKYGSMSLDFFETADDKRGMINALSTVIYLARQARENDRALLLNKRAIEISQQSFDTLSLANALNTRGNIFKDMLLFSEAIDSYFEALDFWESKNDSSGIAIAYGSIGLMYFYQEDYRRALEFNFKKLPVSEENGELWELSKTLNSISQIYGALNMHDSSLFYLRKNSLLTRQMNIPSGESNVAHNMAITMFKIGEIDSALLYVNSAIEIAERINDATLANCLVTRGQVLKELKQYRESLKVAERAYTMAKEQYDPMVLANAAALMSDISHYFGMDDRAYLYLVEYHSLKDSISNNDYLKKVTRLEIQNEYDRKHKEDELKQAQELYLRESKIRKQKTFLKGLIILILLLGILSFLYIRHNRLRLKYTSIDLEQRLLRAQMNPHFIFNSLCAVQDFILANKPKKANAFLVKIASLMRNILENSKEEYISLDKEIETLKLYLDVQQLRFKEEFEYIFNIDESIDTENLSVPPMLAQPCLENSIEHGLLPQKIKGHLEVSYTLKNDLLMLEVIDNGVGRKKSAGAEKSRIKKKSISTKLTQRRLDFFRKTLKEKNINYEITDLYNKEEAAGTKVVMIMPCKKIFA